MKFGGRERGPEAQTTQVVLFTLPVPFHTDLQEAGTWQVAQKRWEVGATNLVFLFTPG